MIKMNSFVVHFVVKSLRYVVIKSLSSSDTEKNLISSKGEGRHIWDQRYYNHNKKN